MLGESFPFPGIVQGFRMNSYDEQWGKKRVTFVTPPKPIDWMSSLEINKNSANMQEEAN
jgi:hypothetical protein